MKIKDTLPKYYPHQEVEEKLSHQWLESHRFEHKPNAKANFTIVVPPPNVTGVLHLGHTLNATVQDILSRRARVGGYNVCWVPGSDHASIATEAKVVEMLKKEKNIEKKDLNRKDFLVYAQQWKDKHGHLIYEQFKRIGCSMDWSKLTFTLDEHYSNAVKKVFVTLYEGGLIYKGSRMIHWDTVAQTALSDEEVNYKDEQAELYYIQYQIKEVASTFITVATKRPETIMGDVALCVNPNDQRYSQFVGKHALVPLIDRLIPIITDESVDPNFGTGVLKITPAHAVEDYHIGEKHNLPIIQTFNLDGTLNEEAQVAVGKTIAEAKDTVLDMLARQKILLKRETYQTRIGYSERTGVIIEPFISNQWFLKMKDMVEPALKVLEEKDICFFPRGKFENTYYHWMHNIKDWCISRQLWWGHRIPAWYDKEGNLFVAETEDQAYEKYKQFLKTNQSVEELKKENYMYQDADCLDTWFSSWLWPIELFKGITNEDNPSFKDYYPTSVLVTGHDILFFWVARMIVAGLYFKNKVPFRHVYFTGMVRDSLGRKMSKSLGNSPDLLELVDKYSADAVRFGVMICSPAGNDLLFDKASLEQGKSFNNKLWNVWKLMILLQQKRSLVAEQNNLEKFANTWMLTQIRQVRQEVSNDFEQYKLSESLKKIYTLIRHTFCNDYMEWIKPNSESTISNQQYDDIIYLWRSCLQLLHPFMPYITEMLFNQTYTSNEATSQIFIEDFDANSNMSENATIYEVGNSIVSIVAQLREAKQRYQIQKKQDWGVYIEVSRKNDILEFLIRKLLHCPNVSFTDEPIENAIQIPYEDWQIAIKVNTTLSLGVQQQDKIKKELQHQQSLLSSIQTKLNNAKFIAHANADVIEREHKKLQDTQERIKVLGKNV